MFRKDRMGRRGGGVLLYIKETIQAYEVQILEEADCKEAIWCKLATGHTTVTIGVVYRCPNITKENNEKIHNLTRFNKIATQGAPQMAVDKEANSLSRVYSYYSKFNLRLFYM